MNPKEVSWQSTAFRPFYTWLIISGLVLFGFFLIWRYHFIEQIIEADITKLSLIIGVVFFVSCGYLGVSAYRLSQMNFYFMHRIQTGKSVASEKARSSAVDEYLDVMLQPNLEKAPHDEAMHAWLAEQIHKGHRLGWFISDSLIRLGLVGTVIGFIIMLGSVYNLEGDDISVLQDLMSSMGGGMQVALYTTLTGISLSLVLGVYCKNLDSGADELVSRVIQYTVRSRRGEGQFGKSISEAT
ncbi:MAG: MotA/TolQ/ExbB proton channel family protein [Gammaproteobacteria bacterium]|nr:MotA/TolQ/ExbB proton channel family protein [Gammaproteobacteria bacterium]MCY4219541.1 MotA/TolQ/ExbB proton channel family protein [Gammaproteobacteria bacterium]MCY4275446.1 MotA/TolQ/ExbB proton channel family protein [Gammaproteobacteria bacterium]